MVKNSVYRQFAERFAAASIQSLLNSFNSEVGHYAWHYSRSLYDAALIDEFIRRGIDVSTIYDGETIDFSHPITYDLPNNKVIVIN